MKVRQKWDGEEIVKVKKKNIKKPFFLNEWLIADFFVVFV